MTADVRFAVTCFLLIALITLTSGKCKLSRIYIYRSDVSYAIVAESHGCVQKYIELNLHSEIYFGLIKIENLVCESEKILLAHKLQF